FRRRRDLVVDLARKSPGLEVNVPQGAFYLFPKVTAFLGRKTPDGTVIETSGDLAMYLLDKAHVATVDGDAFCTPGYIRLSYATADDIIVRAMERIATALAALS
ncbi:MAG: aspartate aminotransferase, partial [Muribaculaceae bacterium]|nr:aspartate aminotransferase [Muribaculaceae bacterium]